MFVILGFESSVGMGQTFIASCVILFPSGWNLHGVSICAGMVNVGEQVADDGQLGEVPLRFRVAGDQSVHFRENQVSN